MKCSSVVLLILTGALLGYGCTYKGSVALLNEDVTPGAGRFYGIVKVFVHRDIGMEVIELGSVAVSIQAEVPGSEFITLMQKEAAKIGADAVVGYQQEGTSATGVAVRFKKK